MVDKVADILAQIKAVKPNYINSRILRHEPTI